MVFALSAEQRELKEAAGYAQERKQFGQVIGKFQNVSSKVADMYLRLEAARLLVYKAAWLAQQGQPALPEAAAAKLFTSGAWVQSSLDAIQIHGAYGYMKDRARPAGRGRRHHLLGNLRDPARHLVPDAGPMSRRRLSALCSGTGGGRG